jgi:hypothetical protein
MHIWTSIDSPAVRSEFEAQRNELKMRPYEKLRELPEHVTDTVKIDNRDITFTTYRHATEKDDLEIVLTIAMPSSKLLFTKPVRVFAEAFCITPGGEIRPLPKETLYEYT